MNRSGTTDPHVEKMQGKAAYIVCSFSRILDCSGKALRLQPGT